MQDACKTTPRLLAALFLTISVPHVTWATPSQPVDVAYALNFVGNELPFSSVVQKSLPDGSFRAVTGSLPMYPLSPIADGPDGLLYMLLGASEEELDIAAVRPRSGQIVSRVPYTVEPVDPPKVLLPQDMAFDHQGRLWMLTGGALIGRGCFPGCLVLPRLIEINPRTGATGTQLTFERTDQFLALAADEEGLLVSTKQALYRLDPATGETVQVVQYASSFEDITVAGDFDSQGRLLLTADATLSAGRTFFSIDLTTGLVDELPAGNYDEPYTVAVQSTATEVPIPTLGSLGLFALISLLALIGLRHLPRRTASC